MNVHTVLNGRLPCSQLEWDLADAIRELTGERNQMQAQVQRLRGVVQRVMDDEICWNYGRGEWSEDLGALLTETPAQSVAHIERAGGSKLKDELLAASSALIHPHIEGVFAVFADRIERGS